MNLQMFTLYARAAGWLVPRTLWDYQRRTAGPHTSGVRRWTTARYTVRRDGHTVTARFRHEDLVSAVYKPPRGAATRITTQQAMMQVLHQPRTR